MANIIFYFSGTGNCLKTAKTLSKELVNTELISMAKLENYNLTGQYDNIGFVYPTYFAGLPKKVYEFISNSNFGNNKNAYYFAVSTYGGFAGNSIAQLNEIMLEKHNIKLNFGQKLKMFSNYIVMYNMSKNIDEITKKSDEEIIPIVKAIKSKQNNKITKSNTLLAWYYRKRMNVVAAMDKNYIVDENCTGCGICKEVCPVGNINMADKKPRFNHGCEQCVACIQYCPQKAINYKNLTQKRRRYTNPEIQYKELSEMNKK